MNACMKHTGAVIVLERGVSCPLCTIAAAVLSTMAAPERTVTPPEPMPVAEPTPKPKREPRGEKKEAAPLRPPIDIGPDGAAWKEAEAYLDAEGYSRSVIASTMGAATKIVSSGGADGLLAAVQRLAEDLPAPTEDAA